MSKLWKLLLPILVCSICCFGQSRTSSWTLTTTGASTYVFSDSNFHTLAFIPTSASVCTARLEGTVDGQNWFDLSGTQTCTSNLMFHVPYKPMAYVRVNILTFTGTSVAVTYRGSN